MLGDTIGEEQNHVLVTRHDSIADLNGPNLSSTMADWHTAIEAEPDLVYRAVDSTTGVINVGDPSVTLHILGPRLVPHPDPGVSASVYPWLGSAGETVNGHSVVLRLDFEEVRILFPGDVNENGAEYLMEDMNFRPAVDAHVFKAPHHGSHEYHRGFLEAVHPQISVISSGESPDHGHPRANFLGTIGNVSRSEEPLVFSTELVAQFAVDDDAAASDADDDVDPTDPAMLGQARRRFKKRLNGIINIRTDGTAIYCARRVVAGYQFVTYRQVARDRDPEPNDL